MLRMLSGKTHMVFTGIMLRCKSCNLLLEDGVVSVVTFKTLDDALIEHYLGLVHTLDKAGGYALQEHGELIVARFRGSETNIVGLPMEETKQLLTRAGQTP